MLRMILLGAVAYAGYRILNENGLVGRDDAHLRPPAGWRRERVADRRTPGRSERPDVLEEQLQDGLENTFPASDPPAVVSTTISGRGKRLVGTDEVLAQMRRRGGRPN